MSNTNNIPLPLLALPAALSHCLCFFFTALLRAHLQSAQKERSHVFPLSLNSKDVKYFSVLDQLCQSFKRKEKGDRGSAFLLMAVTQTR